MGNYSYHGIKFQTSANKIARSAKTQSFAQMGLEGILTLPSTMLAHMIEIDLFWSYWTKFNKQILIRLETKYKN